MQHLLSMVSYITMHSDASFDHGTINDNGSIFNNVQNLIIISRNIHTEEKCQAKDSLSS